MKLKKMFIVPLFALLFLFSSVTSFASEHVAGTTKSVTIKPSYSYSGLTSVQSNMVTPIETVITESYDGIETKVYFMRHFNYYQLFTTDSNVYGYKIQIVVNSSTLNKTNCLLIRNAVGTYDEFEHNTCAYGVSPDTGGTIWYFNNYQSAPIFLSQVGRFYTVEYTDHSHDEYSTSTGSCSLNANYTVNYTPYTEEDMLDEIYDEIVTQTGQNEEIITKLDDIYAENVDTNSKLESIYNLLEGKLDSIIANQADMIDHLNSIDEYAYKIFTILNEADATDKEVVEDLKENSNNQSDQLNNMNDQLAVNKPSSDALASDVDSNIDYDSIGVIGASLSPFMSNEYIIKMLLASLSLCLVGYIFFGKRG